MLFGYCLYFSDDFIYHKWLLFMLKIEGVTPIIFNKDLSNCLSRLDPNTSHSVPIPKEVPVPKEASPSKKIDKGKGIITADDLSKQKKRTRNSQVLDDVQSSPLLADAIKNYNPQDRQEEIADDMETLELFQRRTRRKLQLPTSSEENNGHDKGSTTDLSNVLEPPSQKDTPTVHTPSPLKPPNQTGQEAVNSEKADEPMSSDTTQPAAVPSENIQTDQEGGTTEKVDESNTTQLAAIPSESNQTNQEDMNPEQVEEPTQSEIAQPTIAPSEGNEALIDLNLDLNPDNQASPTHSKDQGDTDIGQDTIGLNSPQSQEIAEEPTPAITIPTPLQSTGTPEVQEQLQMSEPIPLNHGTISETPKASSSSVNKDVNPDPVSDLDQMINRVKTYSESYSKSISEFSKSLTPPTIYHLSEETKDEVKSFFRMLELPLAEVAAEHIPAFTSCVTHLIDKRVLPDLEHIELEELWSSLGKNLSVAAYCQKEMKDKLKIMDQFANTSGKLDTMSTSISQLKDNLHQLDVEEAGLIARLNQIKQERISLIAQKELISHDLASITPDEQGMKAMISVTRDDYLKNQSRYKTIDHQWNYFVKFFMDFRSMIQ